MADLRTAAQQALEALENFARFQRMMMDGPDVSDKLLAEDYAEAAFLQAAQAIPALRAAQAEPVHPSGFAYRYPDGVRFNNGGEVNGCLPSEVIPYYLGKAPHQQQAEPVQRKPLTEEEIAALLENCIGSLPVAKQLIRAIEAAHGIKEEK